MAEVRSTTFSFDRGIERIVHEDALPDGLPENAGLSPSDLARVAQLDQLLGARSLGDCLEAALKPAIGNKDLLAPGPFRETLDATVQMLREAAAGQPESARELTRAARLLAEDAALRDLLQMYRSLLYQG